MAEDYQAQIEALKAQVAAMKPMMEGIARREAQSAISGFKLTPQQGIDITGQGMNISVGLKSSGPSNAAVSQSPFFNPQAIPFGENPGDMLYFDGESWVILPAPTSGSLDDVLRFSRSTSAPYWEQPEEC